MIEHLMSSSLSGDHQGCAAGFIKLQWGSPFSSRLIGWLPCLFSVGITTAENS